MHIDVMMSVTNKPFILSVIIPKVVMLSDVMLNVVVQMSISYLGGHSGHFFRAFIGLGCQIVREIVKFYIIFLQLGSSSVSF